MPNKSPPNNAIASPSIAATALTCGDHSGFGAECQQPGVCLTTVARRNRVSLENLRRWVRLAGGAGVAKLEREDAAAQPPFVPVVVDDLPSEQVVTIEADGVVVRLPADSSAIRIVAVAAYLGRLA